MGKTKEMILLYSNSSILTVPRPNSGWLRLALGDFGLWLQLKSDLKVELRLVNTQCCSSVFVVFLAGIVTNLNGGTRIGERELYFLSDIAGRAAGRPK